MSDSNPTSFNGAFDEEKICHQVCGNTDSSFPTPSTSLPLRDPNVVDWESPDDPMNPMNWPFKKKVAATTTIALVTILTYDPLLAQYISFYLVPR